MATRDHGQGVVLGLLVALAWVTEPEYASLPPLTHVLNPEQALVGCQGRGCAEVIHPHWWTISSLQSFFFHALKKASPFSDTVGASDPGIHEARARHVRSRSPGPGQTFQGSGG